MGFLKSEWFSHHVCHSSKRGTEPCPIFAELAPPEPGAQAAQPVGSGAHSSSEFTRHLPQ